MNNSHASAVPNRKSALRFFLAAFLLLTVLLLGTVYALCFRVPPLKISEKTTRITGPLKPDGQIDFFQYFRQRTFPPDGATDENGYRIFLRTFGDVAHRRIEEKPVRDYYKDRIYGIFELDPDMEPSMIFPEHPRKIIERYYAGRGEELPKGMDERFETPWTLDDLPMLADWISGAEKPLDATAEMIRKPFFFIPVLQSWESHESGKSDLLFYRVYEHYGLIVELACQFQARANFRIASGDIDGALDDIVTLLHLGRKIQLGAGLEQMRLGISCESRAYKTALGGNPRQLPTMEQLFRFRNELDALPPRPDFEEILENERTLYLDVIQTYYVRGIEREEFEIVPPEHFRVRADQNAAFIRFNDLFDSFAGKGIERDLRQLRSDFADLRKMSVRRLTVHGRGELIGELFFLNNSFELEAAKSSFSDVCCFENMHHLALALLMYEVENGTAPGDADWIEKTTPYLGEVPKTCFRCPECSSPKEGTNYVLVKYDVMPEARDVFILLECSEPVPYGEAIISNDEIRRQKFESNHYGRLNAATRGASVGLVDPK